MIAKKNSEAGFSLIEAIIAMTITVIGLLAVAMLIAHAIRIQTFSRDASMANALARAQVEQLRALPRTDPRRSNGGSLSSNTTNHYSNPTSRFTTRWILADGPAASQDVTVQVFSTQSTLMPTTQIRTLLP